MAYPDGDEPQPETPTTPTPAASTEGGDSAVIPDVGGGEPGPEMSEPGGPGNKPENIAADLKELMEKLLEAVKNADADPLSRRKLDSLDRNTQKAHDSTSENAADFLMQKYQESPGLQKLVDSGLDFAEKLAKKFAPKEMQDDISSTCGDARKFLGGLKKGGPKPSPEGNAEASAEADASPSPKPEASAEPEVSSGAKNQGPELTPPLHKVLDIYQQLVKLLKELLEGPSKDPEEERRKKMGMGQGMSMNLDQETINSALDQMKDLYKNSPTLQKIVDTGVNFAEKIALKFTPAEHQDDVKKGFEQVRGTFKEWKQEAEQERQAQPNAAFDPGAGPVKVQPKRIKPGTVEPESDKPAAETPQQKSGSPRPKGPGFFSQHQEGQDKDAKKKADEESAAALARASKRGEGTRDTPKLQTPDQQGG